MLRLKNRALGFKLKAVKTKNPVGGTITFRVQRFLRLLIKGNLRSYQIIPFDNMIQK